MFELEPTLVATTLHDLSNALALVGPPGGLPEQVPTFVGDLLDTVGPAVDGTVDGLGDAVRSVTPGGPASAPADAASEAADAASGAADAANSAADAAGEAADAASGAADAARP